MARLIFTSVVALLLLCGTGSRNEAETEMPEAKDSRMVNLESALNRLQSIVSGRYIPTAGLRVAFYFPEAGAATEFETAFRHNYIVVDSKQEHGIRDSVIKIGDIEILISSPEG